MLTMGSYETVLVDDRETYEHYETRVHIHLCQKEECFDIFKKHKSLYCFISSCGYAAVDMITCCGLPMITKDLK
jgi:sialic acid synthase SpsE